MEVGQDVRAVLCLGQRLQSDAELEHSASMLLQHRWPLPPTASRDICCSYTSVSTVVSYLSTFRCQMRSARHIKSWFQPLILLTTRDSRIIQFTISLNETVERLINI